MVVLEKTLESPSDCKEIQPVNPKGNQPWIVIRSTDAKVDSPILWPSVANRRLIGKDSDAPVINSPKTSCQLFLFFFFLFQSAYEQYIKTPRKIQSTNCSWWAWWLEARVKNGTLSQWGQSRFGFYFLINHEYI